MQMQERLCEVSFFGRSSESSNLDAIDLINGWAGLSSMNEFVLNVLS